MRFQKCFHRKRIDRFVSTQTNALMRFRMSTLKRFKTIELHIVTYVELCVHASNNYACDIFGDRFHFHSFSNVHTDRLCVCSGFDPLSRAFSLQIHAFFMKKLSVLVWTEGRISALVWTGCFENIIARFCARKEYKIIVIKDRNAFSQSGSYKVYLFPQEPWNWNSQRPDWLLKWCH